MKKKNTYAKTKLLTVREVTLKLREYETLTDQTGNVLGAIHNYQR